MEHKEVSDQKRNLSTKRLLFTIVPAIFILAINIYTSIIFTKGDQNAIAVPANLENGQEETRNEIKINFFAVAGLYNSGTTAMWESLRINEKVAAKKGVKLRTYGTRDGAGGYPPCGLNLNAGGTVRIQGSIGKISSGVEWREHWGADSNLIHNDGLHTDDRFYTIWKHTPPHHPLLTCFRPDTLYVIMVRHPKTWAQSTSRKPYDLSYSKRENVWTLDRTKNVIRMPPLLAKFRTLEHMWAYYMEGYLTWNSNNLKRELDCTDDTKSKLSFCSQKSTAVKNDKPKNIVLVPYETYLRKPKKVIAKLYSLASGGIIDNESHKDFQIPDVETCKLQADKLDEMINSKFFRFSTDKKEIPESLEQICRRLGYSCDATGNLFADETNDLN